VSETNLSAALCPAAGDERFTAKPFWRLFFGFATLPTRQPDLTSTAFARWSERPVTLGTTQPVGEGGSAAGGIRMVTVTVGEPGVGGIGSCWVYERGSEHPDVLPASSVAAALKL
jgi:hypothetical protein